MSELMSTSLDPFQAGNRLLDAMSEADQDQLRPCLEEVRLELKEVLYEPGGRIDSAYFPLTSVVSALTVLEGTPGVEVATIGNEGLVGLSLSWAVNTLNPRELLQVQVPGLAFRMDANAFMAEHDRIEGLTNIVRRYTQAYVTQIGQQVACNGLHSIEERCARWLLLTHDRVGSDEFPLTQEFLSQMLGVRRSSVTVVAGLLQQAGFIAYRRGRVTVTDREGLEAASCDCYKVLREVFDRFVR
jgi:CRP-like cAMP-binding protein